MFLKFENNLIITLIDYRSYKNTCMAFAKKDQKHLAHSSEMYVIKYHRFLPLLNGLSGLQDEGQNFYLEYLVDEVVLEVILCKYSHSTKYL